MNADALPQSGGRPARGGQSNRRMVHGLKKDLRGRFANYVPPVLDWLGLAEVEHQPRNNRMRAR